LKLKNNTSSRHFPLGAYERVRTKYTEADRLILGVRIKRSTDFQFLWVCPSVCKYLSWAYLPHYFT